MPRPPSIWTLTDGAAGNRRQAEALANALVPAEPLAVALAAAQPWRALAPRRLPGAGRAFGREFRERLRQPPELAIGCGRQAALATRLLRRAGARAVQILDPRIAPRHWDLVIAPEHDGLAGDNVIAVRGSLHPVDAAWLAAARAAHPELGALPGPRIGLLLGGPVAAVPWTPADLDALLRRVAGEVAAAGGSLLVSGSRRTPAWAAQAVRACAKGLPGLRWFGAGDGANPYPGLLGWADRLLVSADSINLLSEAAATTATLEVMLASGRQDSRHARFLGSLFDSGRASAAGGPAGPAVPWRELPRVVEAVRQRLGLPAPC
ncbi:mitochondrial fission ELM1 family protein [Coralloluteibacterium stylophorae]|uniref:Mitochondrial fission ELM1 family protein n=1 Tax=Coralloluteibacterium stylophorae TaxID=1776034 RepID=A0A8J8AXR0_9GAMM|nr:ELM1/GtrOC1 family putative glycosyltransferase [Coralloluteibacterium stylophorae]MBS7458492.1 mitochondrial fission ELM1 family protein [Coralloluteibacterium stylophorae]